MTGSSRTVAALSVMNILLLGLCTTLLLGGAGSARSALHVQDELRIRKLVIVGESDKPAIVIAGKPNLPGPALNGREYPTSYSEGRELMSGMIFFNEEGDEMGGLVYNSFRLPNGRVAGVGHLSFDRFKGNQVINLEYLENQSGVSSGLTFYDRPPDSFQENLDLIEAYRTTDDEQKRAEIKERLSKLSAEGAFGAKRLFIGSRNETALLELKDTSGRVRTRLVIDQNDRAALEFLDKDGNVVKSYPE